jgi:hypothetical protein
MWARNWDVLGQSGLCSRVATRTCGTVAVLRRHKGGASLQDYRFYIWTWQFVAKTVRQRAFLASKLARKYRFWQIAEIGWWTHQGEKSFLRKRIELMACDRTFSAVGPINTLGQGVTLILSAFSVTDYQSSHQSAGCLVSSGSPVARAYPRGRLRPVDTNRPGLSRGVLQASQVLRPSDL